MARRLLFKLTRWVVLKYFSYSATPIMGRESYAGKPIAWSWLFEDAEYEKYKRERKKRSNG